MQNWTVQGLNYWSIMAIVNSYANSSEVFDNVSYCKETFVPDDNSRMCKYLGVCFDLWFWQIFDNLKYTLKPFITEPIDSVIEDFDDWYNYIWSGVSCVEPYGKTYIWWNYFVIVLVGSLIFYLYFIFKE